MSKPLLTELNYVLKSLVDYNLLKIDRDQFYNYYNAVNDDDVASAIKLINDSKFQTWGFKLSSIDYKHCDPVVKSNFEHLLTDKNHYWYVLENFFPEISDKIFWIKKFVEEDNPQSLLIFLKSMNKHPDVEVLLRAILDKDLSSGLNWLKTEFPFETAFKLLDHLMTSFDDVNWKYILKESRLRHLLLLAHKLNQIGAELGETWVTNDSIGLDSWLLTLAVDQESILNLTTFITDPTALTISKQLNFGNKKISIVEDDHMNQDYNIGPDTIIDLNCNSETFEQWQDRIKRGTLLVLQAESDVLSDFFIDKKLKASDIAYHETFEDQQRRVELVIAVK